MFRLRMWRGDKVLQRLIKRLQLPGDVSAVRDGVVMYHQLMHMAQTKCVLKGSHICFHAHKMYGA